MRVAILSLVLMIGTFGSSVMAQSNPLREDQKAGVAFDVRLQRIWGSKLAKKLDLKKKAREASKKDDGSPDMSKVVRIFGAMSLPKSLEEAQSINKNNFPLEMFVMIKFSDKSAASNMLKKAIDEGATPFERNGKTYYRPPNDGDTPENIVLSQVDDTTVEMGTEAYVFLPNQREVFSSGLAEAWSKVPDEAFRLAVDLEGAKDLIAEAVELGKQQAAGNPMAAGYLGLVDNAKNLRLSIDLSGKNILTLAATGVNEADAEELRSGLDSILGGAKMAGGMQVQGIKQQNPRAGAALEQILNSLAAKREGLEVTIAIPKPDGFEDIVANLLQQFMGGMASPGFDEDMDDEERGIPPLEEGEGAGAAGADRHFTRGRPVGRGRGNKAPSRGVRPRR